MVSSLAAQLAQSSSLNTPLLVDRSRRKHTESYLFTGREADAHDLESIYALGASGFAQLKSINHSLAKFEDALFSDAVKHVDRTLQSAAENSELNRTLVSFLRLVGPYLMDAPTGKVIEWLVRRFRINEFNVEDVLTLFLHVHESPHFVKMLSILHIDDKSKWGFLVPFKTAAKHIPRSSLVTEMLKNSDIARFVLSLLPQALQDGCSHRALLSFHTSTTFEFITRSKALDKGLVAFLLPVIIDPLKENEGLKSRKDCILSSYILLAAFSQKCTLSPDAVKAVVGAMIRSGFHVETSQFVSSVVSFCGSQDEVDKFPESVAKAFLALYGITDSLQAAFTWVRAEKFISPMLRSVRLADEPAVALIESVISNADAPQTVLKSIAIYLIRESLSIGKAHSPTSARRLLSVLNQRHPSTVTNAATELTSESKNMRQCIERITLSLSTSSLDGESPSTNNPDDVYVACTSADANARIIAVRDLLARISGDKVAAAEQISIHEALLGRVADTNVSVLEALYSNPAVLIPLLSDPSYPYLTVVAETLRASDSSRGLLRVHLRFLAYSFCAADSRFIGPVFEHIVFPHLLFTRPRQKTAGAIWDIIAAPESVALAGHPLLKGCLDILNNTSPGVDRSGHTRSVPEMAALNASLASTIAENMKISSDYAQHLDFLLMRLQDSEPHSRCLGYMVARSLLERLSGEHQINAANRVLECMKLQNLDRMNSLADEFDDAYTVANTEHSANAVALKPSSRSTKHRLQIDILILLPTVQRPLNVQLDWISHDPLVGPDTRGFRYVELMRSVYTLANRSSALPSLTTRIVRAAFISLSNDSLAFLAGIWTGPVCHSSGADYGLAQASLRHAAAFLAAHPTENPVDFQTVLPSVLVGLQSPDARVRTAAVDCITILQSMSSAKKASIIYGYDVLYGDTSGVVQYLDWPDLGKYVSVLSEHKDHFINDPAYIPILHQQYISPLKSDSKKTAGFKQRVLCYLLSHVNASRNLNTKVLLLRALQHVAEPVKLQMLLPMVQQFLLGPFDDENTAPNTALGELRPFLTQCFDLSAISDLNKAVGGSWSVFLQVLRQAYETGSLSSVRSILTYNLEHGLFVGLEREKQIELCTLLLEIGSRDADPAFHCRKLLANIMQEIPIMIKLLTSLRPSASDGQKAPKRAKLDVGISTQDTISSLTLFAEVLGTRPLPGSLELVACILDTLSAVAQYGSSHSVDMTYIQQLLMSALESTAAGISEGPNLSPSAIRLDVLVELIRVAENPQSIHQALLLIASLARLTPESVLHHVMPVFTFMGSNVFHRDDTYSFNVVQKTIDSIVPVMVSSLRRTDTNPLDLFIASRGFLRVFTDAANHVPKHRRTKFFAHLVDVLGPEDFLAPVCMLLVDKIPSKALRQSSVEAQSSLSLSISVLHCYPPAVVFSVLKEVLLETRRLITRILDHEQPQPTFLEASPDDDQALSASSVPKRQAQALLWFVGHALNHTDLASSSKTAQQELAVSDLIGLLLSIVTTREDVSANAIIDDVVSTARVSLSEGLSAICASDFIHAVVSILDSGETRVQAAALDLLAERIPNIKAETRRILNASMNKIIDSIRRLLSMTHDLTLSQSSFRALKSISLSDVSGEESALTSMVPVALAALRNEETAISAMSTLPALTNKVGPRILPHFQELVHVCVTTIRSDRNASTIFQDSMDVLFGLMDTIPTFWGTAQLTQVVNLYLEHRPGAEDPQRSQYMSSLLRTMVKRIPAHLLLPMVCQAWPNLQLTQQKDSERRRLRYFELLKKTLHTSPRSLVLEHLRSLFKLFLEALDASDSIEEQLIPAFLELVVKLNEAAFRPLFRRLFDWAFMDDAASLSSEVKMVKFCHVYMALLDLFKGLMTPYMAIMMQAIVDLLQAFTGSMTRNTDLWLCTIETLSKSISFDDGGFWRDDRLRQLMSPLIDQIAVCVELSVTGTSLAECLTNITEATTDDAMLKNMNMSILMHTRSEDARLRLFALQCAGSIWESHGKKLLGFVAETITFIAECAEDEHDSVVKESRKLLKTVEGVAGSIDGL